MVKNISLRIKAGGGLAYLHRLIINNKKDLNKWLHIPAILMDVFFAIIGFIVSIIALIKNLWTFFSNNKLCKENSADNEGNSDKMQTKQFGQEIDALLSTGKAGHVRYGGGTWSIGRDGEKKTKPTVGVVDFPKKSKTTVPIQKCF